MPSLYDKCHDFCKLLLFSGKSVLLVGAPGTGKTRLAIEITKEITNVDPVIEVGRADLTYDLFMYYTEVKGDRYIKRLGKGGLALVGSWIRIAANLGPIWLVFDEINRCNIEVVLGELFTALDLEYRYKVKPIPVDVLEEIMRADSPDIDEISRRTELRPNECKSLLAELTKTFREYGGLPVPRSFRIIGTMNILDRAHLFKVGAALTRRLAVLYVAPPFTKYECKRDLIQELNVALEDIRILGGKINEEANQIQQYTISILKEKKEIIERLAKPPDEKYPFANDYPMLKQVDMNYLNALIDKIIENESYQNLISALSKIIAVLLRLGIDFGTGQIIDMCTVIITHNLLRDMPGVDVNIDLPELLDLIISSLVIPTVSGAITSIRIEGLLGSPRRLEDIVTLINTLSKIFSQNTLTKRMLEVLRYELPA